MLHTTYHGKNGSIAWNGSVAYQVHLIHNVIEG